jgi:SAM-dependent methyltransferase
MGWRTHCLVCLGESKLKTIIDLGMHPLADTFIPKERLSEPDKLWPLMCDLCLTCGHVQTRCEVDPSERYLAHEYSYTSSNSEYARGHWVQYAKEVTDFDGFKLKPGDLVVELGSNDGFLCEEFDKLGFTTWGVDPSPAMNRLAALRGTRVRSGFFNHLMACTLLEQFGRRVPLIVANNVVNHVEDLQDLMRGVRELLAKDGVFVFELPHWLRTVQDGRIDQIYHEHVSYFTVTSARMLLWLHGMSILKVEENPYHGGSIRVFAKEDATAALPGPVDILKDEYAACLLSTDTYETLIARADRQMGDVVDKVLQASHEGQRVACIGAAAKANTFLNYTFLDSRIIDFITDASEHKIGKYTPATRIPILSDEAFRDKGNMLAVVTSWNISGPLEKKIKEINPDVELYVPGKG